MLQNSMQRYYSPYWSSIEPFFLSEEESRHCVSVMRNTLGDKISVLDGNGHLLLCKIVSSNAKKVGLKFIEIIKSHANKHNLHIAISPTKSNDRIEWFLEKACEIGIGKITPLICQRTERTKINLDRWNKIIISSCKQSSLLHFPIINEATKFDKFLNQNSADIFAASIESKVHLTTINKDKETIILIGPEGDFSEEEFKLIRKMNIKEVTLSENILRVETAGIVAVSQWNHLVYG